MPSPARKPSPAPHYGGSPSGWAMSFRRAKFEWLSAIPAGPPGPGSAKTAAGAVPLPRLALPSKRSRCWIRRRGGCPHPPAVLGNRPLSSVGAAISRPQAFPLAGGRCRAYARRMRVGFGMAEVLYQAGQCPRRTVSKFTVGAAFGRPQALPFRGRPIPPIRGKWPKAKRGREARRSVTDEGNGPGYEGGPFQL